MKALTFHAPRDVRHETVADPQLVEGGDVIVRVELGAVCGSDLHVYRGLETGLDAGTVLGHEFLGEVVEVGRAVRRLAAGVRVVSPFTTSCGVCFHCRRGLTARCERGQLFGWVEAGQGLNGAQSEYVRVPLAESTLCAIPEEAEPEAALLAGDVLATGLYAAERADIVRGMTVAVVGCGPVGLMAVVGARELGAERVVAVDMVAERLHLAARFGAEACDPTSGDAVDTVRSATDGRGADAVIEAVGSPQATRLAFDLVRPGGTVAAVGVHVEPHFAFAPGEAYDKNLTYRAGRCPARTYMERALAIAAAGRYPLQAILSHRLPLADGPRAYDLFDRKLDGCTKVLLRP